MGAVMSWYRQVLVPREYSAMIRRSWIEGKREYLQRGWNIREIAGQWEFWQQLIKGPAGGWCLTPIGDNLLASYNRAVPFKGKESEPVKKAEKAYVAGNPDDKWRRKIEELDGGDDLFATDLILPELPAAIEAKLFDYQITPARQLLRAIEEGAKEWGYPGAWDCSDLGCHARDQLILMADGSTKRVQHIVVGDIVQGWQGPQTVTALNVGRGVMAKIQPVKGESFTVNLDHILTLQYSPASMLSGLGKLSGQFIDITVRDYLELPKSHQAQLKLFRRGVDTWESANPSISPYVMGLMLGDGSFRTHSPSITTMDDEIVEECQREAAAWGGRIVKTKREDRCPSYFFRGAPALIEELRRLSLWNLKGEEKFIPQIYKVGNFIERLELLAGLIDSDGHSSCGGFDFVSKSERLAKDIVFVARSLGLAAYVKEKQARAQTGPVGTYWRVFISGDCSIVMTRLARKRAAARTQPKSVLRTGFTVEVLEPDFYYGFSLSGDGRFLLGDFTVTHNTGKTYQDLGAALATGREVCVICPLSVIGTYPKFGKRGSGWMGAFAHFGHMPRFVLNYESLRSGSKKNKWVKKMSRRIEGARGEKARVHTWFEWNKAELPVDETIFILDEAHNVKNEGTLNQELAKAIIRERYPVIFTSGTLAQNPNHMRATGLAVSLYANRTGTTWEHFLETHGVKYDRKFVGGMEGRYHLARINKTVFPRRGARVRIKDLGDRFPETTIVAEAFETGAADQIQAAFKKAEMELEEMVASQTITEQQGFMLRQGAWMKAWHAGERLKVPSLVAMVQDFVEEGQSVAIFVNFSDVREELCERLHTRCSIHGQQSRTQREACIAMFQEDKARVIVCQIDAGGVGVSLHDLNGDYPRVAIVLPTTKVVSLTQALGRVHRSGGLTASRQIIFFAAGTVEEDLCERLREKMGNMDALNDGDLDPVRKF